jgi:hypothetical protein
MSNVDCLCINSRGFPRSVCFDSDRIKLKNCDLRTRRNKKKKTTEISSQCRSIILFNTAIITSINSTHTGRKKKQMNEHRKEKESNFI